ncbi:MAG: hypothetical protein WD512_06350, partial [Candidatus Paceibacterota bacterium]
GLSQSDDDSRMWVVAGSWEYGYTLNTGEFYFLNDGADEPELLTIIRDFQELKDLWEFYGEI